MSNVPRFCASCGRPLGGETRFCAGCGAPALPPAPGGPVASPPAPPVYAAPPPAAAPPQYYAPPPPRKSGCSGCLIAAFVGVILLLAIAGGALYFFEGAIRKALNAEDNGASRGSSTAGDDAGNAGAVIDDIQEDETHIDANDDAPLLSSAPATAELPPDAKGRQSALTGEIVYKCTSSDLYMTAKFNDVKLSAICATRDGKHRREILGTPPKPKDDPSLLEGRGGYSGDPDGRVDYRFALDGSSAEIIWEFGEPEQRQWTKWTRVESVGAAEFPEDK